ncbi:thiamine-phosphate kinase [bacterium]|nr:thiamine-phosphate kinase [bacterium]
MNANIRSQTLQDLGERKIVRELIAPRFPVMDANVIGIGDDCAVLPAPPPGQALVMTIDPCPTPVVCMVEPLDMYHYGRMTVLINVSDLAAMGARPLGILISTVMPEDMAVVDYERFLNGLAEASREWSCPVVGGNIKDGPSFTATGSAFGTVKMECVMRRTGAMPGDRVCVIGEMGLFWAAVLTRLVPNLHLNASYQSILDDALYKPVARIQEGIALAEARGATACMDSSDGITGCLYELSSVNQVDIVVKAYSLRTHPAVSQVASHANIDARKLMFSWGDWELVCTVPPETYDEVKFLIESFGTPCYDIGEVREGTGKVWLEEKGQLGQLTNFASERFCGTSFFTHGLDAYLDFLRTQPLAVGLS